MFDNKCGNSRLIKYGKVNEYNTIITVYVRQNAVYRHNKKLELPISKNHKRIRFVFKDIFFGDDTFINGSNCDLLFCNCSFTQSIKIENANYVEMNNNRYSFYALSSNYIDVNANKILIRNDNFVNCSPCKIHDKPAVNINLVGDVINIKNSSICIEYNGYINILAKNLLLKESIINGYCIYLYVDNFFSDNGRIVTPKILTIDNENCSFTSEIKSPIIIYNDIRLNTLNLDKINIDKEKEKLLQARGKLLKTLYSIQTKCVDRNNGKHMENQNIIEKRPDNRKKSKVLKIDS